jgi:hypothetical protein
MNWHRAALAAGMGLLGGGAIYGAFYWSFEVSFDLNIVSPGSSSPSGFLPVFVPYVVLPSAVCFAGAIITWAVGARWLWGCLLALPMHIVTILIVFRVLNEKIYPTENQKLFFALMLSVLLLLLLATVRHPAFHRPARLAGVGVTLLLALLNLIPGVTTSIAVFFLPWTLIPAAFALLRTEQPVSA